MEKVLLDTNILLVATIQPDVLPHDIQQQLKDPACTVFFSTASNILEIAIKCSWAGNRSISNPKTFTGWRGRPGLPNCPWSRAIVLP